MNDKDQSSQIMYATWMALIPSKKQERSQLKKHQSHQNV